MIAARLSAAALHVCMAKPRSIMRRSHRITSDHGRESGLKPGNPEEGFTSAPRGHSNVTAPVFNERCGEKRSMKMFTRPALIAAGLAGIGSITIVPFLFYQGFLLIAVLVSIATGWPKLKEKK